MGSWETVQQGLEKQGAFTPTPKQPTDSWTKVSIGLAGKGLPESNSHSFEDVSSTLPAFMEKAPVQEEETSMLEQGWDVMKRVASFGGKKALQGLGLLMWPIERGFYTISSAPAAIATEKPFRKMFVKGEGSAKEAANKVWRAQIDAFKTWIPGTPIPETVKGYGEMMGAYYRGVTGEEPPKGYEWTMDMASVMAAPDIQSKFLKLAGKPVAKPLAELKETISPAWWRRTKLTRKAEMAGRVETAEEIGKSLAKKDLQTLADQLSEQTGKTISPQAVQQRLTQIIKGGITEQPKLQEIANPVIKEFQSNLDELRRLNVKGMAKGLVYTETLSTKQVASLNVRKVELQNRLTKLVPMTVKWNDEQKQILAMGKKAPINVYRGQTSGKVYLDEAKTKLVQTGQGTQVIAKDTGEVLSLDNALSDFSNQVQKGKILTAPYQEQLVKLAGKLKVSGKPSIEKDLLDLGEKIEAGDLSYIEKLGKLLNINKKVVAGLYDDAVKAIGKTEVGVAGVSEKILALRQTEGTRIINKLLKLGGRAETAKIQGFMPLFRQILNTPKGMTLREYKAREKLLQLADKLQVSNKEGVVNDILKIGESIESGDLSYIQQLGKLLNVNEKKLFSLSERLSKKFVAAESKLGKPTEPILKLRESEGQRIVNKLLSLASKTENQKVAGLKPILNKIFGMKYKFPGKQKLVDKTLEEIQDINHSLYTSEVFGGTEYFPRMYAEKEIAKKTPAIMRAWKSMKIKAGYAKKREVIPATIRKQMGEITTAQYPVVKRLIQQGADIETAKLFESIAQQPGSTSRVANGVFKYIPDEDKYGAIRNLFVHPKVYNDIMEMGRLKSNVEKVYDEAIGMWKVFKVSWSPGAHVRNKLGNSVLKTLSGMTESDKIKYGMRAWKERHSNSIEYRTAKKMFGRTTFASEELLDDVFKQGTKSGGVSGLTRVYNKIKKGIQKPGELYQGLEFHDKFTLYLKARKEGKSVIEATEFANKWLFDYSDLSSWEKNYARRLMPFYTFPRKALPRVAEAAVNNPYALYKYPFMAKMATQYSLYKLNITNEDYEKLHKILPEYMKNGSYVLMPYRDNNGDLRFFDWTYVIPWGEMTTVTDRGLTNVLLSNPLYTLVSDIQHNKSSFSGREIWKETDTKEEKTWKSTEYVWSGLVPSLAYKGIYWDKMYRAATGTSRYGKQELIPETVAHTIFGLRTQALDEQVAQRKKIFDTQSKLREMQSKMINLISSQSRGEVSPEDAEELRQQYIQQIQGFVEETR